MLGASFCNCELLTHPFQNLAALLPPVQPVFLDFCSLPGNHTVKAGSDPTSDAEMHNKGFSAKVLAAQAHCIDHKLWQWEIQDVVSHRYSRLVNQSQA